MRKSKSQVVKNDSLPENFDSLEEFWSFWDTHSTADYEHLMSDVDLDLKIHSSKIYCPISKDIVAQLRKQARRQGVSTETLINLWLQEKMAEATQNS